MLMVLTKYKLLMLFLRIIEGWTRNRLMVRSFYKGKPVPGNDKQHEFEEGCALIRLIKINLAIFCI